MSDTRSERVNGSLETAYSHLRQAIIEGRILPGSRLKEQHIAEELGVSRTPVREALKMLQSDGLVTIERNVGALVRTLTAKDVGDLYEFRIRLEGFAAYRAALYRTDEDLGLLTEACEGF